MAVMESDSLLSVSQRFFSPDILQKISNEVNQPIDQIKTGLKSVVPALFMGIFDKGSTKEGAENLVSLANRQVEQSSASAGPEVLTGIFGSNLGNVTSKLGATTGMSPSTITKMLGVVAPMVMGVIGSKIKNEKMNASGLMNFLSQQKASFSGLFIGGVPQIKSAIVGVEKSFWPKAVLLALAATAALWWFVSMRSGVQIPPPILTSAPTPTAVQSISGMDYFMRSNAVAGTTKRFRFQRLNFQTGTTRLATGTGLEIDQIASAMKATPAATIRVEGFTDNTGSPAANLALSKQRAAAVKEQLVSRGIQSSRIEAIGLGASNPISSNETTQGRAANRRIEVIVKR